MPEDITAPDNAPGWFVRHQNKVFWAAIVLLGLMLAGFIREDRDAFVTGLSAIGERVESNTDRISRLEDSRAHMATKVDILNMESRLKDCLNRIQRNVECN